MKNKYYKALRPDMKSFRDGETEWKIGQPVTVEGAEEGGACGVGLHLAKSEWSAKGVSFPMRLFEAEPLSPILGEDKHKIRVASAKIVKEIKPVWLQQMNRFMAEIERIDWYSCKGPMDENWKVYDTRFAARVAAGDAAWDAARDAARNATWDAARCSARDATWDAARCSARDATWDATFNAAFNAARDATWDITMGMARDAARDTTWDAARDASLIAMCIITRDLPGGEKRYRYARKWWQVWKRGYCLLYDINGTFYVYRRP